MTLPRESTRSNSRRLAWIAWVAVCVLWGTTYLAIKIALETIPPFVMGGVRYVVGGAVLAGILVAWGHVLPARSQWGRLCVLGFFMVLLANGGVVWGEQFLPSGLTAVLLATTAFWMVGVGAMLPGGEPMHVRQWAGLLVGFSGILLLVWPDVSRGGVHGRGFALGVLSLQTACAAWAVGSSYTRRHVVKEDVLASAALQMIFGGVMMLVIGTVAGEWVKVTVTPRTAAAWVYLAVAGSILGFAAFSYALQHLPLSTVSLYTYVNPIIAVALGTLVLGEPFHVRMLVAAAIIVGGVVVVGRSSG